MRPSDGEIPEKIAFVLDYRQYNDMAEYKDDGFVSCAFHQAEFAMKKIEDLEISIFLPQISELEDISIAAKEDRVKIRQVTISAAEVIDETQDLLVTFIEDGDRKNETFGMLVILKQPEIFPSVKELYKQLK